jgi:hypothetical protein
MADAISAYLRKLPQMALSRAFECGFVALVTLLSLALTLQGWRARIPAYDMLTYIDDAYELRDTGALPRLGDTSSYGSYSPPGTTWLMLPGA